MLHLALCVTTCYENYLEHIQKPHNFAPSLILKHNNMKTNNLRNFALSAMMLMSYNSVKAQVPQDTTHVWNIILQGPDEPGLGNGGEQGGHRTPAHFIAPPSIVYNSQTEQLVFTGEATQATFTYYIKEEDTEVVVDSCTLTLALGEQESISIATLPAGSYTILLQVGAFWYHGEFTKEDE